MVQSALSQHAIVFGRRELGSGFQENCVCQSEGREKDVMTENNSGGIWRLGVPGKCEDRGLSCSIPV